MTESRATDLQYSHRSTAAADSARRKYLTIMFSDLADSTRLAGAMEAEDYAQVLNRLCAAYQEIVPQFGGTVVQISGDGLLAIFGYPEPNEDDGRTAVMAALELHARMRSFDALTGPAPPLRLHTGVHSGLVLLHEGDSVRGRFELHGSATNIASRLANAAQADEILVSEATLGPDLGTFRTGDRKFLTLKGKDKPIAAFNVHGYAPVGTRFAAREGKGLNPFVGRQRELERLGLAVERAIAGEPTFVAVAGPAGIGKTRLVSELLDRMATAFRTYRGECDAHLGAEPLQPFLQIVRSVLGLVWPSAGEHQADNVEAAMNALGPTLTEHRPVLLHLLASVEGSRPARRPLAASVLAALKALFARLAEDGPVALFIDDWQWADDASRRLLEGLRDLSGYPLLVMLTTRGEAGDDAFDNFERQVLTPFNDDEAAAAIRQVLPNADAFLIDDMCSASGGNPLFIEELCHSVAYGEEDFRTHRGSGWLDILVESRFARLPDDQADLLATAAVVGNVVPVWLLELVTGRSADDPLVRALGEEDFIFPGERTGTLRFKHGITRDVIYDSVGLRDRRALHLRIAEALRDHGEVSGEEEFYEALAYHYGAGGDSAATAAYAELAGNKAMERAALDRARSHYRAALDAIDRLPRSEELARTWLRIARWFGLSSTFNPSADQLPILVEAVKRARVRDDARSIAYAEYWLGYINFVLGRDREAAANCERALATLPGGDGLEAQIVLLLGQSRARCGDYESAMVLLDQGLDALRSRLTEPQALLGYAYGLSCKAMMLADLGRFGEARAHFAEALDVVKGAEHPIEAAVLSNCVHLYLWQGSMEEALETAVHAERVCARLKALYMYVRNRAAAAYARWAMTGSTAEVAQLLETAAWLEENGSEQLMASVYGRLADIMAADGEVTQARHYAARTLQRVRKGDCLGASVALRAVAALEARRGNFARAERYLERAMRAAQQRGARPDVAVNQMCAAEVALERGEPEQALQKLDEAEAAFTDMDMRWYAHEAAKLRARTGKSAQAPGRIGRPL